MQRYQYLCIPSNKSKKLLHLSFCLALFGSVCMLNWVGFLLSLSLRRFLCRNSKGLRLKKCALKPNQIHDERAALPEQTSCGSSGRPFSESWRCPPAGSSSRPPRGSRRSDCHLRIEMNIYLRKTGEKNSTYEQHSGWPILNLNVTEQYKPLHKVMWKGL